MKSITQTYFEGEFSTGYYLFQKFGQIHTIEKFQELSYDEQLEVHPPPMTLF